MLLTRDIVTPADKIKISQSPKDCAYDCRTVTRATARWSSVSEPRSVFPARSNERHNQIRLPVTESTAWHPTAAVESLVIDHLAL